ncbi:hypothetical protein [Streptomyces sp. NBC_00145]|uniref:hypothetical protein n=1 Tax=Streptomyces sp. NBC_00145 TaxID=2975666 RepID=UPI002E1778AF
MSGDAGDVDVVGVVLDEEQDEQTPQEGGVDMEDIDSEDARGLGFQESGPRAASALRRWIDPGLLQDLPCSRSGCFPAQVEQFTVDPAVPPSVSLSRRRTRARSAADLRGRPGRRCGYVHFRFTSLACQRRMVRGVTKSLKFLPWRPST